MNQSFADFEVIVVNDGSVDNELEKVRQFEDPRIRIINQPNAGVSTARNNGVKEARYELPQAKKGGQFPDLFYNERSLHILAYVKKCEKASE